MEGQSPNLPWDALWERASEIPWAALNAFADAAVADARVVDELLEAYDESLRKHEVDECYVDLYVPAVFAMAAPRLSDDRRRRIGESLIARLVEAGRAQDELDEDALVAACGSMGPVVLPAVLDAIERESDLAGAWFDLWNLTELVVRTEDVEIREKVAQACVSVLEKVDRDEIESDAGMGAAWILGWLRRVEYADLLERLGRKTVNYLGGADYREAAHTLRAGRLPLVIDRPWEQPVDKWLKSLWRFVKDWFSRPRPEPEEPSSVGFTGGAGEALGPSEPRFEPPVPIVNVAPKIGRNEPCPCGSGKKYKKCCGQTSQDHTASGV